MVRTTGFIAKLAVFSEIAKKMLGKALMDKLKDVKEVENGVLEMRLEVILCITVWL